MYQKKKTNRKYIAIAIVIIVFIILFFIFSIVKSDRSLNFVEQTIKDTGSVIIKTIYRPFEILKSDDSVKFNNDVDNLKTRNKELESQLKEMKDLLELNDVNSDYEYLNATVINRNVGYWYNTVTIDKGKNSGITKDMLVVVKDGVVGRINKVSNFTSTVKLLTTNDLVSPMSVKINIGDKYIFGILNGYDSEKGVLNIEGISGNDKIPLESEVLTTGLSDNSPSGLLIGKVSRVKTDNFDLARNLEVKSSVNFDNINYVSVLKRKENK